MKKIFTLLLATVMVLSLTACGGIALPAVTAEPTAAATEAPTEAPTESAYIGLAEEWLQSEDTVTVSFETPKEYEDLLYELGYTEFMLNYYIDINFSKLACEPISLTYNSKAFRFDFNYWGNPVVNGETDFSKDILIEGYVLYGTKAEAAQNISPINFENYDHIMPLDWIDMAAPENVKMMDGCPEMVMTNCWDVDEYGKESNWTYHASNYYPLTGNLYNFVHVAASIEDARYDSPRMLQNWIEALMDVWEANEIPQFTLVTGILTDRGEILASSGGYIALSNTEYCFEEGMLLKDWAKSAYNLDGWKYSANDNGEVLYSPEKNYVIMAGPDGSLPVTSPFQAKGYYEIVMLTYDDYCKLIGKS